MLRSSTAYGLLVRSAVLSAAVVVLHPVGQASSQTFPTNDPVLEAIWDEGRNKSQAMDLAQTLTDSIGPRLTGTPGHEAAQDWVLKTYASWGIEASREEYGTWMRWRRGITHVDLVEPRVRSLEAMSLAWSAGTNGPVEAGAVLVPELPNPAALDAFLSTVQGKFVLLSYPEPTCRTDDNWEEWGRGGALQELRTRRAQEREEFSARGSEAGLRFRPLRELAAKVAEAGAAGVITSQWPGGWGVTRIFNAWTEDVPHISLSCEDYGLVARLAEKNQGPLLRANVDNEFLGEGPVSNVVGVIPGSDLADEYVVLSAHFDSWDGGSGATDNATGTVTMMEAMRLLRTAYPQPRRTIIVGHWNGEEQGLNGSRAYARDNPHVPENLQAVFNQDNGTGRIRNVSMQGLTRAGESFTRWLAQIPSALTNEIRLNIPGRPGSGGSDYAAFICSGAPSFSLSSLSWSYSPYTWHTQRDTYDKIVPEDLRDNAVLTAMLAYLAANDDETVARDRSFLGNNSRTGEPLDWPACRDGARTWEQRRR